MKRETSFGTMETLLQKDGKVISEVLDFEREGRAHSHEDWEICYVLEGGGTIINGNERVHVKKGSICKIPPHTDHWMIPDPKMQVLLVYSNIPG